MASGGTGLSALFLTSEQTDFISGNVSLCHLSGRHVVDALDGLKHM